MKILHKEVTLTGMIIALEWDENTDEIILLGLEIAEDEIYFIDDIDMIFKLVPYLDCTMKLKGNIWLDKNEDYILKVHDYKMF